MFSAILALAITFWRLAQWGILAQKFNLRTALEPTTKLSYEALYRPRHLGLGGLDTFAGARPVA